MAIHVLECGGHRPRVAQRPNRAVRTPCRCLLWESPEGLVLIDTGVGVAGDDLVAINGRVYSWLMGPELPAGASARERVLALGHDPADVAHVVLTHLDPDHIGGLRDFPNALVHVTAAELAAARAPRSVNEKARYALELLTPHDVRWRTYAPRPDVWRGLPGVPRLDGLPPALRMISLPGHTRGSAGVVIDDADDGRTWVFVGDALFGLGRAWSPPASDPTPAWASLITFALNVDSLAAVRTEARLRRALRGSGATVVSAHNPAHPTVAR